MKLLYGEGFSKERRMQMAPVIYNNIIMGTKVLIESADMLHIPIDGVADLAKDFLENVPDDQAINEELGAKINKLWNDAGMQNVYERRAEFQLFDSYNKFARDIERIAGDDYEPTVNDVLRSRVRTSGIVEERYVIDNVQFVMYDVGGQRNERKKWIHCFDNVTAVIFVAAISEYDQVLYEDHTTNRMDEALNLFDEICNSCWFLETSMILFLNKVDLFDEKFYKVPFRLNPGENGCEAGRNLSYEGSNEDINAAKAYLVDLFLEKNNEQGKEVYHHITCATDTNNVSTVFNACKDIILKGNLQSSGFMD